VTGSGDWPEIPEEPLAPEFILQFGITVEVTEEVAFGEVARAWLHKVRERFQPVLAQGPRPLRGGVTRFGVPSLGGGGDWVAALTLKSWEKLLDSLDDAVGDGSLYLEHTEPAVANGSISSVRAMVTTESGEWAECLVELAVVGERAEDLPAGIGEHLEGLLMDCVEQFPVTFAQTANGDWTGQTPLESALRRPLDVGLAESPRVLRGYDWLTFVPSAVVEKLGGAEALQSSGAFAAVVPTERGAVLRATERYHLYDEAAADAVFGALACGLPAGKPQIFADGSDLENTRLVDEDASERCASSTPAW
jgi:hypothetical protein